MPDFGAAELDAGVDGDMEPAAAPGGDSDESSSPSSSSGSSSSSSIAAAPPMPEDLPAAPMSIPLEGTDRDGMLIYTAHLGRKELYAVCGCKRHGSCVNTKTCNAGAKKGQGRPIGYLVAWLQAGCRHEGKDQHMPHEVTHEDRVRARHFFYTLPGSIDFLNTERLPYDGEGSEPEVFQ